MRLFAFSVLDTKAEYFSSPFYTRTLGEALRGFSDEAQNPESQLSKHPHDFRLFHVGHFDQANGHFEAVAPFDYGSAFEHSKGVTPPSDIEPQSEELDLA